MPPGKIPSGKVPPGKLPPPPEISPPGKLPPSPENCPPGKLLPGKGYFGWRRLICLDINFSGHLDQQINKP